MEKAEKKLNELSFTKERLNVLQFLSVNPNHFGTLTGSKFKAVQAISFNSYYEEIDCVGYNPKLNEIFATILIKRDSGYSGNLCSNGSNEYVSFCVNYGSGWEYQGAAAINVHDIPTGTDCMKSPDKPLSYVASVPLLNPKRRFCKTEVLPKVRATLSWGFPIPVNNCIYKPIWGDQKECTIQLSPRFFPIFADLETDLFLPKFLDIAKQAPHLTVNEVSALANLDNPAPKTLESYEPKTLALPALAKIYSSKDSAVEPLRYTLHAIQPLLSTQDSFNDLDNIQKIIPELNWPGIFTDFFKTKADVSYEELTCVGLDYNRERLTAGFKIKRKFGYSGNLCQKGSMEHVAFWADWDDNCQWSYVGTASVNVHDIANINDGICYTAVLPVNLDQIRQHCSKPKIVRLRAVLSWQTLPSTTDPNDLNTYGNRLDTHIQIRPGIVPDVSNPGTWIDTIGGVKQVFINAAGLTDAFAYFTHNGFPTGYGCPFYGRVTVKGPSFIGQKYRVQVRRLGEANWTSVLAPIQRTIGSVIYLNTPDPTDYFTYVPETETEKVLAHWDPPAGSSGLWEIKLDIAGSAFAPFQKIVMLNGVAPVADIDIDGLNIIGTNNCKDFTPGELMKGNFIAYSPYHKTHSLSTNIAGATPTEDLGTDGLSPTGDKWEMRLPAATPHCGYYIGISITDNSIVNSAYVGLTANDVATFCVK